MLAAIQSNREALRFCWFYLHLLSCHNKGALLAQLTAVLTQCNNVRFWLVHKAGYDTDKNLTEFCITVQLHFLEGPLLLHLKATVSEIKQCGWQAACSGLCSTPHLRHDAPEMTPAALSPHVITLGLKAKLWALLVDWANSKHTNLTLELTLQNWYCDHLKDKITLPEIFLLPASLWREPLLHFGESLYFTTLVKCGTNGMTKW